MNKLKKNFSGKIFIFLPFLISFIDSIIESYVRPIYGQEKYGLLSTILGFLPSFNAALSTSILGAILVLLFESVKNIKIGKLVKLSLVLVFSIFSMLVLIDYEIKQKTNGLYYDVNDILATIAGTIIGSFVSLKKVLK